MVRLFRRRLFLILLAATAAGGGAAAQSEPDVTLDPGYAVRHFTVADGLPGDYMTGLLQGHNGYLWVSTIDGLARYDGFRFTAYTVETSPGLPSHRFQQLVQTADGTLWAATETQALVRYRAGAFATYDLPAPVVGEDGSLVAEGEALRVRTGQGLAVLTDDRIAPIGQRERRRATLSLLRTSGERWVAGGGPGADRVAADGRRTPLDLPALPDGSPPHVRALFEGADGDVWVSVGPSDATRPGRVYRVGGGAVEPVRDPSGRPWAARVDAIGAAPGAPGAIWLREPDTWWTLSEGRLEALPAVSPDPTGAIAVGPDGALWRTQGRWLYRNETPVLQTPHPQRYLAVDTDGNLWTAGREGLYRVHPLAFETVAHPTPGAALNVNTIAEGGDGQMWLGLWATDDQLARVSPGGAVSFADVDPGPAGPDGPCCQVNSILADRGGAVWAGTANGVCRMEGERCIPTAPFWAPDERGRRTLVVHEDRAGRVWVGQSGGLSMRPSPDAGWTAFTEADGLPRGWVRVVRQTRAGDVLLGTNGSGLLRYREGPGEAPGGGSFEPFTTADGLSSDLVRDLYEDGEGLLWVVTEDRGLCRVDRGGRRALRGAAVTCLDASDGLFQSGLHRLLDDGRGRFWFNTNRGVFWVERAQLEAFARGDLDRVGSVAYTARDGIRNVEGNGGFQPAGIRASDGRLWFPTQDGALVFDPDRVESPAAPPAVIEGATAGGRTVPFPTALALGADMRDVEFEYTALAFSHGEDVQFRIRLDGYDGWRDVGPDRRATYTNLPPGRYTFRVQAGWGGSWNGPEATLALTVAPFVYETWWFLLLCGVGAIGLAVGGVQLRTRRLRQRQATLSALVRERTEALRREKEVVTAQAEALRSLDEAKSRVFANVSHEFRTPLTLILGPLEDLREDLAEGRLDARATRRVDAAIRNGRRLLTLVNQLLDVSRLEAGGIGLRARELDAVPFVAAVAQGFVPFAESRDIRLHVDLPPGPVRAWLDPEQIEKVLANLLGNALKFTPSGGTVRLGLTAEAGAPGALVLTVRDDGPGIAADHLPHLFERFYQADASSTRRQAGTGIGLALAKSLVDLHRGEIAAESEAGVGSTFTVRLPLGRAHLLDAEIDDGAEDGTPGAALAGDALPGPDAVALAPAAPPADTDGPTVLVVDDNPEIRAYLRAHLEPRYRVAEAADGREALAAIGEALPDLVVSDVMMPELDGFGLCRAIREDPELAFLPVILLTARASAESRFEGLALGADDYLTKPFDVRELTARVDNLIASRKRLQADHPPAPPPAEPAETVDPFVVEASAVIAEGLYDEAFGVEALGDALGMSRSTLYRRFAEAFDASPMEVVWRQRLETAAHLLREHQGTVGEVAYGVGFKSVAHFSNRFREAYGRSPAAYAEDHAA